MSGCEQDTLFELILAANFMNVQPLLDLTCAAVAAMSKGKTQEELKVLFRVANDLTVFTPEQEAEIREQNAWAEQP